MKQDYQGILFDIIKRQIQGTDSIGNILGEVLSISQDAVYRRYRGETQLTIYELEKICRHFNISLDSIFELNNAKVLFDIPQLVNWEPTMEAYLQNIHDAISLLKEQKNPEITTTIINTPLLQLFNFPHLVRFKLFFWAKSELQMKEFENAKFKYEKITDKTFTIGRDILKAYNGIPSKEIYDQELLIGILREVYYFINAQLFEDPNYALVLLDYMEEFVDHLHAQATVGKKYIYGTEAPAFGSSFEMYYNETNNGVTSIYYSADGIEGLYIAHNRMNLMHTNDPRYLAESKSIISKQLSAASLISVVNEKERNKYFTQIKNNIALFRKKIEFELMA